MQFANTVYDKNANMKHTRLPKRYWGPALAAAMIALIAASLIWLKDYTPFGGDPGGSVLPSVALRLKGAELVGYQRGKPAWKFHAGVVEVGSDRVHTTFTDIYRGVVFADGKAALNLSGKRLVYNAFTHDIQASGSIRASADGKLSLATDTMNWNAFRHEISCPEAVSITTAAGKGSAQSLIADLRNESIEMKQGHLRIPVEEELFQ